MFRTGIKKNTRNDNGKANCRKVDPVQQQQQQHSLYANLEYLKVCLLCEKLPHRLPTE
jgi:hypothetical protein